jgi:hypothetical protein
MPTIVHRRYARDAGPSATRGPGAGLDALTWVGWVSAAAAFGFVVFGLRSLLDLGDFRFWDWNQVATTVLTTLRDAAFVVLPAALELGVPGARRRTPWLMRGAVLLALEQVSRPALDAVRDQYFTLVPDAFDLGFDTPAGLALMLVGLAVTLVGIAGAWALSDGLADAGARPRRWVLTGAVAAGLAVSLYAYLPVYGFFTEGAVFEIEKPLWWVNLAGLVLGFVDLALWLVVSVRLASGPVLRLRPRRAWLIGAAAGLGVLVLRFALPVIFVWGPSSPDLVWLLPFVSAGPWILLAVAFAAGLGRGRERREERPRRLRLFVLDPTD